jgi:hypothetical protein
MVAWQSLMIGCANLAAYRKLVNVQPVMLQLQDEYQNDDDQE